MDANSPQLPEGIDRNEKPKMTTQKKLIIVLLVLLAFMILFRIFGSRFNFTKTIAPESTINEPTPLPLTGTFVDSLTGTVLYFIDETLYELSLPSRVTQALVGVDEKASDTFLQIPPVFSPDGTYLAIAKTKNEISVISYDTGRFVSTFTLPKEIPNKDRFVLSFSPYSDVVAVGILEEKKERHDDLLFFDVKTGKQIGLYSNCHGKGVWLSEVGFASTCWLADQESVVIVKFSPESTNMVTVAKSSKTLSYEVLPLPATDRVFVIQSKNGKSEIGTLAMNAVFTPFTAKQKEALPTIDILRDPNQGLKKRIQDELQIKNVSDVSVSSDGNWLVYETEGKLFLTPISLKDKPFEIGTGSNPRVRPY